MVFLHCPLVFLSAFCSQTAIRLQGFMQEGETAQISQKHLVASISQNHLVASIAANSSEIVGSPIVPKNDNKGFVSREYIFAVTYELQREGHRKLELRGGVEKMAPSELAPKHRILVVDKESFERHFGDRESGAPPKLKWEGCQCSTSKLIGCGAMKDKKHLEKK